MVWNMYDFFTLYADVDGWEWDGKVRDPSDDCDNVLDIWIISRLHQLMSEVDKHMQAYDLPNATKPILPFIDDASNWYVRRSRKRFWKHGSGPDKQMAYKTLHYVLVQLAHVLAPFTPFMAEELYKNLTGGESVHLNDWPESGHVNELLIDRMANTREIINEGLSLRASEGIKVRQPLAAVNVVGIDDLLGEDKEALVPILLEELNVKSVTSAKNNQKVSLDTKMTEELKREGLAREVVRMVQGARKEAGLEVDDRIILCLEASGSELEKAIVDHRADIEAETLATITDDVQKSFAKTETVESHKLSISLSRSE